MARTGDKVISFPKSTTPRERDNQRFLDFFNALPEPQQRVLEAMLMLRVINNGAVDSPAPRRVALNAVNQTKVVLDRLFASF